MAKLNPRHMLTVRKKLEPKAAAAAEVKRQALFDELGHTSGGRGVKYRQLPNTSSAPGQSPIKQTGELQNMVGAEKVTDILWDVGMFPKNEDERKKAAALEYGYQPNNLEARAYLERVKSDPVSTRDAVEAAQKAR